MQSEPSSGIKLTAYSCICWLFHRIYYDARNHKHKIRLFIKDIVTLQGFPKTIKQFGQVRLGYVWFGLVWFGQVRLGQVRLGQVRLGYVRLGQVRLGQVMLLCYVILYIVLCCIVSIVLYFIVLYCIVLYCYRYAQHNDVSVNDGPHVRRWSHKIKIL